MVTFEPVRAFRIPRAWWKPKPKPETPDLLMTLPPELRNRIYELSFEDLPVSIDFTDKDPALLQVSRTIGTEATRLYFGSRRYFFFLSMSCVFEDPLEEEFKAAWETWKLARLVQLCGKSPFMSFEILSLCDNCVYLKDLFALLGVMRASGLEPDKGYMAGHGSRAEEKARSMESAKKLFHTHSHEQQKASMLIARAIAMGRRARDHRWSKMKLEKRCSEFIELAVLRPRKRRWPSYL